LRAVLEKLGEKGVPDFDIPAKLSAAADQLIELRAQLARVSNDRPELAAIRAAALALIDKGELDGARAKLNQGREAARASREEASRKEAEFLADEARIDHLQLAYRAAADKYAAAGTLVAPFDREAEWQFLMGQASELDDLGREFGDNAALTEAIDLYRKALERVPREARPLQWAGTQNNLGTALSTLGERESGTARLEQAVAAYREVLTEFTRERVPLQWAMTQNNLGTALSTLGKRESGTARLEQAVAAFRAAL
jgi:tetratricopeptide (TPR) repeat protein